MPSHYNITPSAVDNVQDNPVDSDVFSANGRENAPNIYRRNGVCWARVKIGGQEIRQTLRTRDLEEARARAGEVIRQAQRQHFGMIRTEPGQWLYFVHDQDATMVKVGISTNVDNRFRSLKANTPNTVVVLGSVPGSPELEKVLHEFFAPFHHRREWFRATPEVLTFIAALVALAASQ